MYGNHPNIPRKPIGFTIEAARFGNLEKRARAQGYKVNDYARMLFDAAYAARVGQERGDAPLDRDLDRQVRSVFMLADCEPDFIAEALGIPKERVRKIIAGWKQVLANGGRRITGVKPTETVVTSPGGEQRGTQSEPATRRRVRHWTDAERLLLKRRWSEGATVQSIAQELDRPAAAVQQFINKHRGLCPKRRSR
ncbi:MAG: hypothetical protein RLO21_13760 [Nitratireductor sp.]